MRNLKALVLLSVAALALAGCSGAATAGDTSASGGTVDIDFYQTYPTGGIGGPAITQLVDKFNSSQKKVHVTQVNVAADQQMAQMQTEFASGKGPDVSLVYYQYLEYIASNLPYDDPDALLKDAGQDSWLSTTYDPAILKTARSEDGHQIGFPYELSSAILFLNDDVLAQAGVDKSTLSTWEGVHAAAQKIKAATGKPGLYINEGASYTWEVQGLIESAGGSYFKGDKATIASPQAADAYKFYTGMINDGSALHTDSASGLQAFTSGGVGMALESNIFTNSILSATQEKVSPLPVPAFEGKKKSSPIGGDFLLVTAKDKAKQQASLKFVQYMLEPANLEAFISTLGFAPATKPAAASSATLQKNAFTKTAFDQLVDKGQASRWASFPGQNGLQADKRMAELRDAILNGATPIPDVLKKGQSDLNDLLANG